MTNDLEIINAYGPTVYKSSAGGIVIRVSCVQRRPLLLIYENNDIERELLADFARNLLLALAEPVKL